MHGRVVRGVAVVVLVSTAGCRSSSDGRAARDVAAISEDVARRTGSEVRPPADEATLRAARAELLARPLAEEAAVKLALLGNPSVRASYERLGVARAELLQAGLVSNPVFTASVTSFAEGPDVELGLLQSFLDLFFVPLRRRVAAEELCATQAEVARTLVRLVYDVRRALVRVRAAQDVVRVRREALDVLVAARDLMRRLHDAGNVRDADLTVEEIGAARAQLDAEAADLAVRDAREALNVLLGLRAADTRWTVEGALPPLPPATLHDDVPARAVAASLDLLEVSARFHAAVAATGLARRQGGLSHLDLGVVGRREPGDGAWGFGPEVSTAIPIFDDGTARALAEDARAREHLARHEHLTVEVEAAARRLHDRVVTLRSRETFVRERYLALRARLVDETTLAFNAMQIGAFDVLDAKVAEADARREHVETLAAAWLARLDLGELLSGSLHHERVETLELPDAAEGPTPPKGH